MLLADALHRVGFLGLRSLSHHALTVAAHQLLQRSNPVKVCLPSGGHRRLHGNTVQVQGDQRHLARRWFAEPPLSSMPHLATYRVGNGTAVWHIRRKARQFNNQFIQQSIRLQVQWDSTGFDGAQQRSAALDGMTWADSPHPAEVGPYRLDSSQRPIDPSRTRIISASPPADRPSTPDRTPAAARRAYVPATGFPRQDSPRESPGSRNAPHRSNRAWPAGHGRYAP